MVGLLCGGCGCGEGKYNFGFTLHKIILNSAKMAHVTLCIMKSLKERGGKAGTFKTFVIVFFISVFSIYLKLHTGHKGQRFH